MNINHESEYTETSMEPEKLMRMLRRFAASELSAPEAPEPWTIDAFEDILSCHKLPAMDDAGRLWDRSGPLEQMTTLFD